MTFAFTTCVSSRRVSLALLMLLSFLVLVSYSCFIVFVVMREKTPSPEHNDNHSDSNNSNNNSNDDDNNHNLTSEYNPEFAWRGLHYCKAAYCATESLIDWSCGSTCDEVANFEPCFLYVNESFGTLGFAGLDHVHKKIVLSFRGSSNIANWIEDLSYWAIPFPSEECGADCMVHRGFYHSYESLRPFVLMDMADLHIQYPRYTLFLTGHSLGAALALLSALDLATWDYIDVSKLEKRTKVKSAPYFDYTNSIMTSEIRHISLKNGKYYTDYYNNNNKNSSIITTTENSNISNDAATNKLQEVTSNATNKHNINKKIIEIDQTHYTNSFTRSKFIAKALAPIEIYTFGEPRVGNAAFSLWSTRVLSVHQQFRVTHGKDVVPHLPPQSSNYIYVPQELWYNNSYRLNDYDDNEYNEQRENYSINNNSNDSRISENNAMYLSIHIHHNDNDVFGQKDDNHSTMYYRICEDNATYEDANCSNSVWSTSVSDHLLYLGVCTRCECTSNDMAEIYSYKLSDKKLEELRNNYAVNNVS